MSHRNRRNRRKAAKKARATHAASPSPVASDVDLNGAADPNDGAADLDNNELSSILREFQESDPQYIGEEDEDDEDDEEEEETHSSHWLEHPPVEDKSQPAVDTTSPEGKANIDRCRRLVPLLFTPSIKGLAKKTWVDSGHVKFKDFWKSLEPSQIPMTQCSFPSSLDRSIRA